MAEDKPIPSALVKKTHESLRQAVKNALERKRRLGQYSVIWKDNQIILEGEDAPNNPR